jgi:hypothetical protein
MTKMDATSRFFLCSRLWWSVALFVGPIIGAITGQISLAVLAVCLLVLPTTVLFDTDRPWWPDEVRRVQEDADRTKAETRKLTLWSGVALASGVAIALLGPWG